MTPCCHHWRIESPNGPTSHGRCLRCGAGRDFLNWNPGPMRTPPAAEKAIIARVRREEGAIAELIHTLGQDRPLTLAAYRRNLHREEDD